MRNVGDERCNKNAASQNNEAAAVRKNGPLSNARAGFTDSLIYFLSSSAKQEE